MDNAMWGCAVMACTVLGLALACVADAPPMAPRRPVTDEFYGTKVTDPYRYFEDLSDPQVQAWIKAQAEYARKTLDSIPGRKKLLERIRELDRSAPYRISIVRRWPNGDLHYLKALASENLDKLYFRDAATGQEKLLVDPDRFAQGGKHASLSFCEPSPNKRLVAYGIAMAGSEQTVLHVLDMETGKDLPDVIDRMESDYTPPHWLADSSGFVYSRRRLLPPDAPPTEVYKETRAYLHPLGGDPARDTLIFAMGHSAGAAMAEADFPSLVLTSGSRWMIGKIKHGDANELTLYCAPADSLSSASIAWKKICDVPDQVTAFSVHGDEVYLLTASDAPRYRVVATSLANPDFKAARTIVPAGDSVVRSIAVAQDALYVGRLEAGVAKISRVKFEDGSKPQPIALPQNEPSGGIIAADPDTNGILVGTEAWTRRGEIYAYEPATGKLVDTHLRPHGRFDAVEGFTSTEVMVPSHDGVMVPLSIMHKTGLKLDGSHPTLVSGYGAYGMTSTPRFNPVALAWLERGGVLALAHVRGGGEFGRPWHQAGRMLTKPNTWKDFIACCEYLVKQGYTSKEKLAGVGGSAGGILIGRAVTQRPDLFAAALMSVGCLDAIRMETTTNGVPNIQEFGTVKTPEGFKGLLEMSAYAHVVNGVKYPAVLLNHGINDPRVEPWESAKMCAALQAATSSGKPILFRVDYDAGHGIGSTKSQREELTADQWSFLLWQMGEADFQPR